MGQISAHLICKERKNVANVVYFTKHVQYGFCRAHEKRKKKNVLINALKVVYEMLSEERMELGMYGVLYFLERKKCLFVSSFLFYIYKRNTQFHIVIGVFKFFFLYLENKHI